MRGNVHFFFFFCNIVIVVRISELRRIVFGAVNVRPYYARSAKRVMVVQRNSRVLVM